MGYILKNTSGLINTRLTDTGRLKLSQGNFNISYFQIGDSEVSYNTLPSTYNQFETNILEPSFNAQNSTGVPESNKENVKYPYYVDGLTGNTYGIPYMASIVSPVYNRAVMRGFFTGNTTAETINWSALTNNLYAINSNYVVKMNQLNGSNTIDLLYHECNKDIVRNPMIGDIITIYYDGNGLKDCSCSNYPTPTPTPTPSSTPTEICKQWTINTTNFEHIYTGITFQYSDCCEYPSQVTTITLPKNDKVIVCSLTTPIPITTNIPTDYNISFDGNCSICPSPSPTPTPTKVNCETPTPTPTPSTTCCLPPEPSKPCPLPPPPDCVIDTRSCYPILTYKIIDICLGVATLDRPTPDFSYLSNECYARTIIYPPTMVSFYDSFTPRPHWNDNVINFESVCYTDEFDVKIWNMNIPWSENPAGLNSAISKDYTQFGSIQYLGTKEYLGYASNSGQTDTDSVYYFNSFGDKIIVTPEEQKAIAIIHYTNQTVDFFYGEKFALEPFENVDDTTGQARNFRLHIPWLMWHKNPECCYGQTFWVDPPGFEELDLFKVHYLESKKNLDMNSPGIRYYHLWDNNPNVNGYPNRIGKVFPDAKIIIIDDEEIIAAMSYRSNRNWTLPAPRLSLVTPNTCGDDVNSSVGILTGESETLYVTYRLTNTSVFTNSLHNNYYSVIQGPNLCLPFSSQNVAIRFGSEFGCLNQLFNPTTTTTTFNPTTTTTTTIYTTTTTTICPNYCDTVTGFYADKFEIIVQKVPTGERPSSSEWKILDFTSQLASTTINGYITQEGLTGNTFVITQENYDDAPYYNLTDYINLTPAGFQGQQLNFGDEYYFYGALETDIQATIYEMRYKINLGQAEFQTSSNPTWKNGTTSYVTEIGLFDSDKNLMILSKMQSPIVRQGIQQFLIKFDI